MASKYLCLIVSGANLFQPMAHGPYVLSRSLGKNDRATRRDEPSGKKTWQLDQLICEIM